MMGLSKSSNNKIHITNAWHALFTSSVFKYFCSLRFFCFSVSSLHSSTHGWGPRFVSTAAYFLSDLDKKMETHWGYIVWMTGIQHLICFSSKLELHLKCWFWFLFIHWIKTKSHQWEDENIFFMQPFLRYKAFMWTVYFLKPNLIFCPFPGESDSFTVLWTCQLTVSYPFSLAAVMATQRRPGQLFMI